MASIQLQDQSLADLVGAHVRMRRCLRLRLFSPCLAATRAPRVNFDHLCLFIRLLSSYDLFYYRQCGNYLYWDCKLCFGASSILGTIA